MNYNAPGQVVVAGNAEAVARVIAQSPGRAWRADGSCRLPMSVPVHCRLMAPAAARFEEVLSRISRFVAPRVPDRFTMPDLERHGRSRTRFAESAHPAAHPVR